MTYENMIALLRKGGVNVENFDHVSLKTLGQLFEEIENRDVDLVFHKDTGRVIRCAVTVAILVQVPNENLVLLETKRVYRNGKVVKRLKEWSMSETCKRGEELLDSAIRGVREELGLEIAREEIDVSWHQDFLEHESSVYCGVRSHVMLQRLFLKMDTRPWKEEVRVIDDLGTKNHLEWFRV